MKKYSFGLKNLAHIKTTLSGIVLIGGAIASVFITYGEPAKPIADWPIATPVILIGLGCLGIGPNKDYGKSGPACDKPNVDADEKPST